MNDTKSFALYYVLCHVWGCRLPDARLWVMNKAINNLKPYFKSFLSTTKKIWLIQQIKIAGNQQIDFEQIARGLGIDFESFDEIYANDRNDWPDGWEQVAPPVMLFLSTHRLDLFTFLSKGYVKNWRDGNGQNALFYALTADQVDFLVDKIGMSLDSVDANGFTAITYFESLRTPTPTQTFNYQRYAEAHQRLLHHHKKIITKNVDIESLGGYVKKGL